MSDGKFIVKFLLDHLTSLTALRPQVLQGFYIGISVLEESSVSISGSSVLKKLSASAYETSVTVYLTRYRVRIPHTVFTTADRMAVFVFPSLTDSGDSKNGVCLTHFFFSCFPGKSVVSNCGVLRLCREYQLSNATSAVVRNVNTTVTRRTIKFVTLAA